jgi:hypothetical protein
MTEYTPITLTNGLNDVTYMNDGRITEVKWDIPIYFLRGNTYENIGTINDIRGRKNFNGITDANSILIGTVDELRTGRLFIRISEEEKIAPSKLRGGKSRKSKRSKKSSNKKRKQRKTKRRRTKKNKIRPIIYGGASVKQYGIATALRSLIFTYFPHNKGFETINLSDPASLDKYGLTNTYTTVMDLLNQIVHNDDGRSTLPREKNFGDFLKYSQDLDSILSVIISDIKNYLREQFKLNKINSNSNAIILNLITNIENDLPKEAKKEELPASASAAAQGVVPGRTRISVTSIFSKVSPDDRQSKYPLMCQYLRIEFPSNTNRASSIAFNFFENTPMSKEDLAEILDLFKQYIKFGYIGPEYDGEIKKLQEEVDKK